MKCLAPLLLGVCFSLVPQWVSAQEASLSAFFQAVQQGEVEKVTELMHPQLVRQIDPPILEAWLQAVAYRLGRVEAITPDTEYHADERSELTADIVFSKGNARAELVMLKGQIVAFSIKSEKLANWFQRPTSLQFYRQRGEEFLKAFAAGQLEESQKLLHPKIAEQFTEGALKQAHDVLARNVGNDVQIQFAQSRLTVLPDERLQQIELIFDLQGELGEAKVAVVVRFHGMQGHLVGFHLDE